MSFLDKLRKKTDTEEKAEVKPKAISPKKEAKKTSAVEGKTAVKNQKLCAVLKRPIITEKATLTGTYVFEVQAEANKTEISKAVKQMYGVLPKSVNIIKVKGKKVRSGQRAGQRKDWKKAVVSLNKGETIKVYEGA